jgi:hypothetical protein
MTSTYEKIATTTVSGSSTDVVTFSSISGSYTDLVLVINYAVSNTGNLVMRFNSDTGANYSDTELYGDGSTAGSQRRTSGTFIDIERALASNSSVINQNAIVNIQNYSNTTTYKTALIRSNETSGSYPGVDALAGLWRSTSAITSVSIITRQSGQYLLAGSTFTLYGIKAE